MSKIVRFTVNKHMEVASGADGFKGGLDRAQGIDSSVDTSFDN